MVLLNKFEEGPEAVTPEHLKTFLKLLAPFAPFITEELYAQINADQNADKRRKNIRANPRIDPRKSVFTSIHLEPWPKYNAELVKEDTFELIIQVNGKVRGRAILPFGAGEEEAKKAALGLESVEKHVVGEPRKVIFVPNKLINFVI